MSSGGIDYTTIASLTLFLLIIIGLVFLVIREGVCWYAKINERIELQRQTNGLLEAILKNMSNDEEHKNITVKGTPAKGRDTKEKYQEDNSFDRGGNKTITINL